MISILAFLGTMAIKTFSIDYLLFLNGLPSPVRLLSLPLSLCSFDEPILEELAA
jgi:hypothetical protein